MTKEITEHIRDILNNADWYQDGLNPSGDEDREEAITNIYKVFEDAGYMYVPPSMRDHITKYVDSAGESRVSNK